MLEKFLKMLFNLKLKKNINLFLIILALLILALLLFGNFNLIEGNLAQPSTSAQPSGQVSNPRRRDPQAYVGEKTIQSFTEKMVQAQNY